jgi:hypothetical protein
MPHESVSAWRGGIPPQDELATAPVVSRHNEPQPSPQLWDCGCVTAVYVTDRDYRDGERPFEMRLIHPCGTDACELPEAE